MSFIISEKVPAIFMLITWFASAVDDKVELVEKLERLMEEKPVVKGVEDYYRENFGEIYGYDDLYIFVKFYRPSKEFPIGWQPLEAYGMEDYPEIGENLILSIEIPWDSDSVDEHLYKFKNPNKQYLISDIYRRQMQEDGSFILIPEDRTN